MYPWIVSYLVNSCNTLDTCPNHVAKITILIVRRIVRWWYAFFTWRGPSPTFALLHIHTSCSISCSRLRTSCIHFLPSNHYHIFRLCIMCRLAMSAHGSREQWWSVGSGACLLWNLELRDCWVGICWRLRVSEARGTLCANDILRSS